MLINMESRAKIYESLEDFLDFVGLQRIALERSENTELIGTSAKIQSYC